MAKKSLLKNLLTLVYGKKAAADDNVSPRQAKDMQLACHSKTCDSGLNPYIPPYMEVAKQLFSEKDEIFQAAVYYLVKIAENESKYAEPISMLLKDFAKTAKISEENAAYLQDKINRLETKSSIMA
jgi:hypothetical protein